ncbi:MAG: hypothetical protein IPJ41_05860 [Phycisphaerales bacterium]|nr:hypothetical protein [Phycisphaerales bacterium]
MSTLWSYPQHVEEVESIYLEILGRSGSRPSVSTIEAKPDPLAVAAG